MRTRLAAGLGFVIGWVAVVAEGDDHTGFRVMEQKDRDGVTLRIESRYAQEFTVTVDAELQNMTPSRPLPFTVEAAGRSAFNLVRFDITEAGEAWRYRYRYHWLIGGRGNARRSDWEYAMPFSIGIRPRIMQGPFGSYSHQEGSNSEHAVDWDVPEGTVVRAARGGEVVAARNDSSFSGRDPKLKPLANYVVIKHDDGTFAEYQHLQKGSVMVEMGDEVVTGDPIARSGNTGYSTAPHLHFSVFQTVDGKTRRTLPYQLRIGERVLDVTELPRREAR